MKVFYLGLLLAFNSYALDKDCRGIDKRLCRDFENRAILVTRIVHPTCKIEYTADWDSSMGITVSASFGSTTIYKTERANGLIVYDHEQAFSGLAATFNRSRKGLFFNERHKLKDIEGT